MYCGREYLISSSKLCQLLSLANADLTSQGQNLKLVSVVWIEVTSKPHTANQVGQQEQHKEFLHNQTARPES